MTLNQYRRNVERYTKDKASLDKDIAKLNSDISKLKGDIIRTKNGITRNTSSSTLKSKGTQINRKEKTITDKQQKVAGLEKKRSDKLKLLNKEIEKVEREQVRELKKQDTSNKKRRDEELRHARKVTSELRQQAMIQSQMIASPITIDLTKLPEKITVLLFAANPLDQDILRLGNEVREIEEQIRLSEYRDSVEFISKLAVRSTDLLQAINEHNPHIIHFSGHGSDDGIVFETPNGNSKFVTKDAIVQLINTMSENVRVVLFNTCFSSEQAKAIVDYVDVAIGMNDSIDDETARIFASKFYSAIGFGKSIGDAFKQAKIAIMLEGIPEEDIPEIHYRDEINPFEIILVRP